MDIPIIETLPPIMTASTPAPIQQGIRSKITGLLKQKKNLMVLGLFIVVAIGYYLYKNNKLSFIKKKTQVDDDLLNLDKEYYINDSSNNKIKIELKELIANNNLFLEQQEQLKQDEHLRQQQQLQEQLRQQQMQEQLRQQQMQEQLRQQQLQEQLRQQQMQEQLRQEKEKEKKYKKKPKNLPKIIHPEESIEEESDNNSSTDDIEELKNQLAELEKKNYNVVASNNDD
jgi:hypothetical protein